RSRHAYFIRTGDGEEPIRFEVDRTRNGRSFVTRRVEARQSVGAILTMAVSFHVDEDGPQVQTATMPDVPSPDTLDATGWSEQFDRRFAILDDQPGRAAAWIRMRESIGEDEALHSCALAYVSDDLPT